MKRINDLEKVQPDLVVENMTLEELARTKVKIGKTYNGYTFDEMWRSHMKWMLKAYEGSEKVQHRMLHRYAQLKVMQAEANRAAYVQAKAKSKSGGQPGSSVKEEIDPHLQMEMEEELEAWEMAEVDGKPAEITHIQSEVVLLSGRLDNMEGMISQILTQIMCLQQGQTSAANSADPWSPRVP